MSEEAYDQPAFQAATIRDIPAKGLAGPEQARVLWKVEGYTFVDIRSDMEGMEGRIRGPNKGSVDIPMFHAKAGFDSILGKRSVKMEANRDWLNQMKARFPNKDAKILLFCSDGTSRSAQAVTLLHAQGYTNVIVMAGGYNKWDQMFDNRLAPRPADVQQRKAANLEDPVKWGQWA